MDHTDLEIYSPLNKAFVKVACVVLFVCCGLTGGYVGQMIARKHYPLSIIERVNLTRAVGPGDPILLAQHVDRRELCDVVVKRRIITSTGQRFTATQVFDESFGPTGGDKYILPVPTDPTASMGDAVMWSKGRSWCNWLDYLWPTESEAWELHFTFAELTEVDPMPPGFERIGFKAGKAPKKDPPAPGAAGQ